MTGSYWYLLGGLGGAAVDPWEPGAPTDGAVVELVARLDDVHEGTTGVRIRLVLVEDGQVAPLTGLEARAMRIRRPDGAVLELGEADVSVSVTEAGAPCLEWVTPPDEPVQAGVYRVEGWVRPEGGGRRIARPAAFRVGRSLAGMA